MRRPPGIAGPSPRSYRAIAAALLLAGCAAGQAATEWVVPAEPVRPTAPGFDPVQFQRADQERMQHGANARGAWLDRDAYHRLMQSDTELAELLPRLRDGNPDLDRALRRWDAAAPTAAGADRLAVVVDTLRQARRLEELVSPRALEQAEAFLDSAGRDDNAPVFVLEHLMLRAALELGCAPMAAGIAGLAPYGFDAAQQRLHALLAGHIGQAADGADADCRAVAPVAASRLLDLRVSVPRPQPLPPLELPQLEDGAGGTVPNRRSDASGQPLAPPSASTPNPATGGECWIEPGRLRRRMAQLQVEGERVASEVQDMHATYWAWMRTPDRRMGACDALRSELAEIHRRMAALYLDRLEAELNSARDCILRGREALNAAATNMGIERHLEALQGYLKQIDEQLIAVDRLGKKSGRLRLGFDEAFVKPCDVAYPLPATYPQGGQL